MTTHRRAWGLRAAVVAALVAGGLLGVSGPAMAKDPDVQITNLSTGTLKSGERADLQYAVRNNNDAATPFNIQVQTSNGLTCQGDCNIPVRLIQPGETATFNARLVAGKLNPGENRTAQFRITGTNTLDEDDADDAQQTIALRGPDEAPTVKKVSGTVIDAAKNEPIEDALVVMVDAKNQKFDTKTNDDGKFTFTGSAEKPIAPGRIDIAVTKDGYKNINRSRDAGAGQSVSLKIGLTSTTAPSATPSAEESPPPDASEPAGGADASGPAVNNASGDQDSGGGFSWLFIILGGLLVALGVGAIVLLIVRRKQDARDDDEAGAGAGPRGPTPVPVGRGAYGGADPTRVTNRAGMGGDPTMVARPGMADAPTVIQRPVVDDEFPDPYGAPLPPRGQQPGWAGAGYPVNGAAAPGYAGRDPRAGYGNGAAPAPAPERYDEPTGRFSRDAGGDFGPPTSAYQPDDFRSPAGPRGGYEPEYEPAAGGYEPRGGGGYEPQAGYGGGGFEPQGAAGYEPQASYEPQAGYEPQGGGYGGGGYEPPQAGYEPQRGYEPQPGYDEPRGGYDEPQAGYGYDPRGGGGYDGSGGDRYEQPGPSPRSRHAAPPSPGPGGRSDRRSLDWLDD